jgi:hypothetical protein
MEANEMSAFGPEQAEPRNLLAAMEAILRLEASFYMHMTEAILDYFGSLGEKSVRDTL